MKLKFILSDGKIKISNDFYVETENLDAALDDFFEEFLGGSDNQPEEMFWNAKIESDEDNIIVKWLDDPKNPQETINAVGDWFGQKIDDYVNWT